MGSSDAYPAAPAPPPPPPLPVPAGDEPPDPPPLPSDDAMQLMLALFFIATSGGDVSRTPNSLTPPPPPPPPRAGQVRAVWPLLLQCEHRLVIAHDRDTTRSPKCVASSTLAAAAAARGGFSPSLSVFLFFYGEDDIFGHLRRAAS